MERQPEKKYSRRAFFSSLASIFGSAVLAGCGASSTPEHRFDRRTPVTDSEIWSLVSKFNCEPFYVREGGKIYEGEPGHSVLVVGKVKDGQNNEIFGFTFAESLIEEQAHAGNLHFLCEDRIIPQLRSDLISAGVLEY